VAAIASATDEMSCELPGCTTQPTITTMYSPFAGACANVTTKSFGEVAAMLAAICSKGELA